MSQYMKAVLGAAALYLVTASSYAEVRLQCEQAIRNANEKLYMNNLPRIRDIEGFASLLRYLTQNNTLPRNYITTAEAKRLGWSGHLNDSLWRNSKTKGKIIGGDKFTYESLADRHRRWYSVYVDVENGYHGDKKMYYSPNSPNKYLTTDGFRNVMPLESCQ